MSILRIFAGVVVIHLIAFVAIFATPGCQTGGTRHSATPDSTVPGGSTTVAAPAATGASVQPQPVATTHEPAAQPVVTYTPPAGAGRAAPTRPGSPAAIAITPSKPVVEDVAPVSSYTVQRGDSLWSIAKKNNLTVSELAKANSLGTNAILQPGRKLLIPGKPVSNAPVDLAAPSGAKSAAKPVSADAAVNAARASGEEVVHIIQAGEKLGSIARKYQVTVNELASANNITDPARIRVGQKLVIPGFKAVSSKPAASTAKPASTEPAAVGPAKSEASATPAIKFDLKPPPPGQDLDAGLKDAQPAAVPTVKVEEQPPKN
jgi:LysM repeat protein